MQPSGTLRVLRAVVSAALSVLAVVAALVWSLSITRRSIAFAFAINWALMGLAFVVWLIVPIRVAGGYYRLRPFERSGRMYDVSTARTLGRRTIGRSGPERRTDEVDRPDAGRQRQDR